MVTSGKNPNPMEWQCLSNTAFDQFPGLVDAEEVYLKATIMYRCPESDNLWFFSNGMENSPALYEPRRRPGDWCEASDLV